MPLDPAKPIRQTYAHLNPDGSWLWGLGDEEYERVRQGYGCDNCREPFVVGGLPAKLPRCPVCRKEQEWALGRIVSKPEDW